MVVEEEALPQSKAVPGVFGVLVAEPKEANAPEPSPNAEDLPGGAVVLVFSGVMPFVRDGRLEPTSLEDNRFLGKGRPELSLERSVLCLRGCQPLHQSLSHSSVLRTPVPQILTVHELPYRLTTPDST